MPLYKMAASGNDFVMFDGRNTLPEEWSAEDIRAVCARRTGCGADGVVFIQPGSSAGAVRMTYFNSDGSRAALCGNAALCTTRLAAHLGLGNSLGMKLETDSGIYDSRCARPDGRAELHLAPVNAPAPVVGLALEPGERAALGMVGVPHLVVLVDDVERVNVMGRGQPLRHAPVLGPSGANVNFVGPAATAGQWRMRTYERGVEGETLACGSGAVAVACALESWGLAALPLTMWTQGGCGLEVRGQKRSGGGYDDVWLVGEARMVFRGVLM